MAATAAKPKTGGGLGRKAGPLPVWAWLALAAVAGYLAYRHFSGSGAASGVPFSGNNAQSPAAAADGGGGAIGLPAASSGGGQLIDSSSGSSGSQDQQLVGAKSAEPGQAVQYSLPSGYYATDAGQPLNYSTPTGYFASDPGQPLNQKLPSGPGSGVPAIVGGGGHHPTDI